MILCIWSLLNTHNIFVPLKLVIKKNKIMKSFKLFSILTLAICFETMNLCAQAVTVYSENNYSSRGGSQTYNSAGEFRLTSFSVRSIRISPGYLVIMANESGCTGLCTYWRSNAGVGGIIGAQGCSIRIIAIDASAAQLQVKMKTGSDDLRNGSLASLQVRINGRRPLNQRLSGPYPNNHNTDFRMNIPNTRIDEILDFYLSYTSGSSGIGETTDNWNLDQFEVLYRCGNCPEPIYLTKNSGSPLIRFTGERRNNTFYPSFSCN